MDGLKTLLANMWYKVGQNYQEEGSWQRKRSMKPLNIHWSYQVSKQPLQRFGGVCPNHPWTGWIELSPPTLSSLVHNLGDQGSYPRVTHALPNTSQAPSCLCLASSKPPLLLILTWTLLYQLLRSQSHFL